MISPVAVARAVARGRRVLMTRGEMIDNLSPLPHCSSSGCVAHTISAADDRAYADLADIRSAGGESYGDDDHDADRAGSSIIDDVNIVDWEEVSGSLDQTTISPSVLSQFVHDRAAEYATGRHSSDQNPSGRLPLPAVVDQLRRAEER